MSARSYAAFEALFARALTAPDPVGALRAASRSRKLSPDVRQRLALADEDGLRMTALLVARLRFERLLRGSPAAGEWFDRDPAGFAAAFRRYHAEVAPSAFFPRAEAELFDAWRARR